MLRPESRQNTCLSQVPTFFTPTGFGLETLDPINTTGITFFSELGRRLTDVSGDPRETTYLFQSLIGGPALQFGGIQTHLLGPH